MSQIASQVSSAIMQATSQLGQPITYTPLNGSPVSFSAVIQEVDAVIGQQNSPVVMTAERRNFLIQISDYSAIPDVGDTIEYAGDVYTVMIPDEKTAPWEWNDKFNVRRRVFTKRTS